MSKNNMNIPLKALCFKGVSGSAEVKEGKIEMVSLSGNVIPHFYWGNCMFDLSGMVVSETKYPILHDHLTNEKVGFSGKPIVVGNQLKITDGQFVDTPIAKEIQTLSDQGFPYQASVRFEPLVIEKINSKQFGEVNGFKIEGPGTIFRKWEYKESSLCIFGIDAGTSSKVFSGDDKLSLEIEEFNLTEEEVTIVDLKTLKEKHPELVKEFSKEFEKSAKEEREKLSQKIADLETKLAKSAGDENSLKATEETLNKFKERLDSMDEENKSLRKFKDMTEEKALQKTAMELIATKLSESTIPERLQTKVGGYINPDKFIKEGKLDVESFTAHIDVEIKSWEDEGLSVDVKGFGTLKSDSKELQKKQFEKEDDEAVAKMLEMVGETTEK